MVRRMQELAEAIHSAPEGGCASVTVTLNLRPETGCRLAQELEVGAGQKS